MIELKENHVKTLLNKAIQQAKIRQTDQLVCITKKIKQINPIHVFELAKTMDKDRIFWSSPVDDFYIVGIGKTEEISVDEARFSMTKDKWTQYLSVAMIHNPYGLPGTGLLTLGGLSFDPKKERTALWGNYHASQFVIPEYIVTKVDGDCYFTVTINVKQGDDAEALLNQIHLTEKQLTKQATLAKQANVILKREIEPEQWLNSVHKAIETLQTEQASKIVLARELRLRLSKKAELAVILKDLLEAQELSYIFAFEQGEDCFIGATPERLVKVTGNQLLSTCLAGTSPRGETEEADQEMMSSLFHDDKNRKEHNHVVAFIHENIKAYCTDIDIPNVPVIYPLKNLLHLYTPVTATLKKGYHLLDLVEKLHPTPALGGTPQEESLQFIRENELLDRGWYGAPIGWLDSNENGEFAVAIRSGLIQGEEVSLFAGCGVMKDSNAQLEYEETSLKFLPMLSVLED